MFYCIFQKSIFPLMCLHNLLHFQWVPVLMDFKRKDSVWGFVPPAEKPTTGELQIPITLHLGDYNLDGFPDALVILRNTSSR